MLDELALLEQRRTVMRQMHISYSWRILLGRGGTICGCSTRATNTSGWRVSSFTSTSTWSNPKDCILMIVGIIEWNCSSNTSRETSVRYGFSWTRAHDQRTASQSGDRHSSLVSWQTVSDRYCSRFWHKIPPCSVYHQYRGEILKRTAPVLRAIAKKRKKKEQEALMKATKLAEIEEATMNEQENRRDHEQRANTIAMPSPVSNRLSSPLPTQTTKQSNPKPIAEPLPTKGKKIFSQRLSNKYNLLPSSCSTRQK